MEQAPQQGFAVNREGKLNEAQRLYSAILHATELIQRLTIILAL